MDTLDSHNVYCTYIRFSYIAKSYFVIQLLDKVVARWEDNSNNAGYNLEQYGYIYLSILGKALHINTFRVLVWTPRNGHIGQSQCVLYNIQKLQLAIL